MTAESPELALFYFEPSDDRWVLWDRYPREAARWLLGRNRMGGYRQLARTLREGLRRAGIECHFNPYGRMRDCIDEPVGILGKNLLLDQWHPDNPVVFGPCMLDHPKDRPDLFERFNAKYYLVPSAWVRDMFVPYFGDRVLVWPIGIDLERWPDFAGEEKTIDFLIYEKFLWDRPAKLRSVLAPIIEQLQTHGFSTQVLHCGSYTHKEYRQLLRASKRMVFLCEHETQGQSYQEALACNVPVVAWDQGQWLDPKAHQYEPRPVPASSVPYFAETCGMTFRSVGEFREVLPAMWEKTFSPRSYVVENLDLVQSARRYFEIVRGPVCAPTKIPFSSTGVLA